jgi:hypothetical protein
MSVVRGAKSALAFVPQGGSGPGDGAGSLDLSLGGNWNIVWPVIDTIAFGPVQISGTTCPLCIVEVFANGQAQRQAETYVGSGTANASGEWTLTVPYLPDRYLAATATSLISGTSELNGPWDSGIDTLFLPLVVRNP